MFRTMLTTALAAIAVTLLATSQARAWGAAHVGYTHVGPSGVYHAGRTVAAGPGGVYSAGRVGAYGYGGAAYRGGYDYRAGYGYGGYGAAYGGYRYTPSYYGGVYPYGYIR